MDAAASIFHEVLLARPEQPVALYSLAVISLNHGNISTGLDFSQRCLRSAPGSPLAWYIHGLALKSARHFDEALLNFDQALALDAHYVDAHIEKANIYLEGQDFRHSLAHLDQALAIQPEHPVVAEKRAHVVALMPAPTSGISALAVRGLDLQNQGRIEEAQEAFRQTLEEEGSPFVALYSLAAIAINQGRIAEGLDYAKRCLQADTTSAYGAYIYGCALKADRQFAPALEHLNRALELNPQYVEALIEKGIVYGELKDYVQALIQFNEVIRLNPEHKLALVNLATSLTILKRHDEGSQYFSRLLELDPGHDYAIGALVHARLHSCNWTDFAANRERIIEGVRAEKRACKPLAFLAVSDSPADQLICARIFTDQAYPLQKEQFWKGEKYSHRKPRIGYVSPDFREHPVGHLMAGVFEHHDKEKYEIHAFSLGIEDGSRLRERFKAASDRFTDVRGQTSRAIAQLIRESEIDLLIDLAGPTMDAQPDIFAFQPAPIQVSFLGYPGTSGASYYQYILGDRIVIPEADRRYYSEEVVYLPGCYLPTDSKVAISPRTPTREEMKLPPQGFIYCSFNHDYKMNPDSFEVWMNILKRVEGSVLWLMKLNDAAETNLRREAENRGVSAERLIFATRVPAIEDHLARYRLAGLFLDTHPYNAHTTASDALRSGLPVLTLTGHSFQSRVATSIVSTVGMPQLAKATRAEYEEFAVDIGLHPEKAQALKDELQAKLPTATIYNTEWTTRGLEAAYEQMLGRPK